VSATITDRRYSSPADFLVVSTSRCPLLLAHQLSGLRHKVNATAASTIEPQFYRGAERAAEVTLLRKNRPLPSVADSFWVFDRERRGGGTSGIGFPDKS
jgi:hypothetical protein